MKRVKIVALMCVGGLWATVAFAGVSVSTPSNGATVGSPARYVAAATSPSCSKGVASIGIYTAPNVLAYVVKGATLDTTLNLKAGTYNTVVQEWDNCGWSATTPIKITVDSSGGGTTTSDVKVSSPANGSTLTSPVNFAASATTSCAKGVAAMGIYTASGVLAFTENGASLNTSLALSPGTYNTVVEEWDNCGQASTAPVTITVDSSSTGSTSGGGRTFSNLQKASGWTGYALLPPNFPLCSSCKSTGPQLKWAWNPGISSPSLSGSSTETVYGAGTVQWADAFWNNHLIGDYSSQGLPDYNHSLIPTLHDFTYDIYFWLADTTKSQAMEFDINQFVDGKSYIWGHECRIDGGHEWDTWNNQTQHWAPSGVACNPISGAWNHLTLHVQRTTDDHLIFQSITLNGNTATINRTDTPTNTSWYGVTINYQIDGDQNKDPYNVYIDNFNFTVQ